MFNDIFRRVVGIALLCFSFLLVGAPGGGGHGGGGVFGGGGYHGAYSGAHGAAGSSVRATASDVVLFSLIFIALFGAIVWMIGYAQEAKTRSSGGLSAATVRVTVAVVIDEDSPRHSSFLNDVLTRSNFASPSPRVAAFARVRSHLAALPASEGFVCVTPFPEAGEAAQSAATLSRAQIACVDGNRQGDPTGKAICLAGFTATVAPGLIEGIHEGSTTEHISAALLALEQASPQSMDAFYLFYSPAPNGVLTESQARNMLNDLRALETAPSEEPA